MSSPDSGQKLPKENPGKGTMSEGQERGATLCPQALEPTCLCQPSTSKCEAGVGGNGGKGGLEENAPETLQGGQQGPLGFHCSAR